MADGGGIADDELPALLSAEEEAQLLADYGDTSWDAVEAMCAGSLAHGTLGLDVTVDGESLAQEALENEALAIRHHTLRRRYDRETNGQMPKRDVDHIGAATDGWDLGEFGVRADDATKQLVMRVAMRGAFGMTDGGPQSDAFGDAGDGPDIELHHLGSDDVALLHDMKELRRVADAAMAEVDDSRRLRRECEEDDAQHTLRVARAAEAAAERLRILKAEAAADLAGADMRMQQLGDQGSADTLMTRMRSNGFLAAIGASSADAAADKAEAEASSQQQQQRPSDADVDAAAAAALADMAALKVDLGDVDTDVINKRLDVAAAKEALRIREELGDLAGRDTPGPEATATPAGDRQSSPDAPRSHADAASYTDSADDESPEGAGADAMAAREAALEVEIAELERRHNEETERRRAAAASRAAEEPRLQWLEQLRANVEHATAAERDEAQAVKQRGLESAAQPWATAQQPVRLSHAAAAVAGPSASDDNQQPVAVLVPACRAGLLIPDTESIGRAAAAKANNDKPKSVAAGSDGATCEPREVSRADQVSRALLLNKRRMMRRDMEMRERRTMTDVDLRQQHEGMLHEQRVKDADAAVAAGVAAEAEGRRAVSLVEQAAWDEFSRKESRQRATVAQWLAHKQQQVAARGLAELEAMEVGDRAALADMETVQRAELVSGARDARRALEEARSARIAQERAALARRRQAAAERRAARVACERTSAREQWRIGGQHVEGFAGGDDNAAASSAFIDASSVSSVSGAGIGARQLATALSQRVSGSLSCTSMRAQASAISAAAFAASMTHPAFAATASRVKEAARAVEVLGRGRAGGASRSSPTPPSTPAAVPGAAVLPATDIANLLARVAAASKTSRPDDDDGVALTLRTLMRLHPHFSMNVRDVIRDEQQRMAGRGRALHRGSTASASDPEQVVAHASATLIGRYAALFRVVAAELEDVSSIGLADLLPPPKLSDGGPIDEQGAAASVLRRVLASAVRAVKLSGNALVGIGDCRLLGAAWSNLRHVDLRDNRLTDGGWFADASANTGSSVASSAASEAAGLSALLTLDASQNRLADLRVIQRVAPNVVSVRLTANKFAAATGEASAGHRWSRIAFVEAPRNELGLSGVEALLSAASGTLGYLDISHNKLGSFGAASSEDDPPTRLALLEKFPVLERFYAPSNGSAGALVGGGGGGVDGGTIAVLPNLGHLFVSQNRLSGLVRNPRGVIFAPLLTVLMLQSNQLASLSGLAGCTMLDTLDVSFNALDDATALLRDLSGLKRLLSVSVNDNPCVRAVPDAAFVRQQLAASLPMLRTVNADPLSAAVRASAVTAAVFASAALQGDMFAALRTGRSLPRRLFHSRPPSGNATSATTDAVLRPSLGGLHGVQAARAAACDGVTVTAALDAHFARELAQRAAARTANAQLHRLAKEREDRVVQWFRAAGGVDAAGGDGHDDAVSMKTATKSLLARDSKLLHSTAALPLPQDVHVAGLAESVGRSALWLSRSPEIAAAVKGAGVSIRLEQLLPRAAEEEGGSPSSFAQHPPRLVASAAALLLRGTSHADGAGTLVDVRLRSETYRAARDTHRESTAAAQLLRWMRRCSQRRTLLRTMRKMLLSAAATRERILGTAARKIQPVWRGAWTRMRLKKALAPAADDDDDEFERVDVDAELAALESGIAAKGAAARNIRSMGQASSAGKLFELPPEPQPVGPSSARGDTLDGGAPGRRGAAARLPDHHSPVRPSSMPTGRPSGPHQAAQPGGGPRTPPNLGSSSAGTPQGFAQSAGFAPVAPAFGATDATKPTALPARPDEEWGDVAAQIRKRDVKRAKEKQRTEAKTRTFRK